MSDLRTFGQMQTDAYRLCDVENAITRFPAPEVGDYVNRGINRVYTEMLKCWDQPFYIVEPPPVQIPSVGLGQVSTMALPMDYLQMIGISWSSSSLGPWCPLDRYRDERERTELLTSGSTIGVAGQLRWGFAASPIAFTQGIPRTTYSIELVPTPSQGSYVRFRYVPSFQPLVNLTDVFDGIAGFYDAATTWAAILMRRKDDLETSALDGDWQQHLLRITSVARRRDRSSPPQTSIVMNWGSRGGRHGRRGMR